MATKKKAGVDIQEAQEPKEQVSNDDYRFPVEQLIETSRQSLGVETYIAAGAFYGIKEEDISIEEAKGFIKKFLEKRVDNTKEGEK